MARGHNFIDETGKVHGRLTVISEMTEKIGARITWKCRCICGNDATVSGIDLRSGNTSSCGCYRKELTGSRATTHGYTKARFKMPEYFVWQNMINRCHRPNSTSYQHYGGRGIKVCDRWRHSFPNFLADLGERPEGLTLDRINVNGDYEPLNCKWSTQKEQVNNRRIKKIENFSNEVIWEEFFKRYPSVIPPSIATIS